MATYKKKLCSVFFIWSVASEDSLGIHVNFSLLYRKLHENLQLRQFEAYMLLFHIEETVVYESALEPLAESLH